MSHELKTPVGAVGLLAEAVLDAADDPAEVRRFGTKIVSEANRLGNLVTELIALSRLTGAEGLPGAVARRHRRGGGRGAGPHPALGGGRAASRSSSTSRSGWRSTATRRCWSPRCATSSRTRSPTRPPRRRCRSRGGGSGDTRRDRRHRPRHRHRPGAPEAGVRAVLPGRPGPLPRHRRHRAGAGDRQARAGQPRRRGAAVEQPGHRLDVHDAPARSRPDRARRPTIRRNAHDQGADRRGRGVLRRPAGLPAAQGGLHHGHRRHRAGRAGGVRPQRRRHRAARPHAARHERHRRLQGAAHPLGRAGDHGDGAGQRDRQGGRAGARGRRLRHQALLGPGADRAGAGRAAPRRRGRAATRARPACSRPGRCGWTSSGTS